MSTGLKSSMVRKWSTLKWIKKPGFGTKVDMKRTKFLPFRLKMAASILIFSCECSRRPQKIKLSRICRDWTKMKNRPRPPGSAAWGVSQGNFTRLLKFHLI